MNTEKVLLVIDMQNDFVTGALANEDAQKIIGGIRAKIAQYKSEDYPVFFTRDTHGENYLDTQEGRLLPVSHCIKDTEGWQVIEELAVDACEECTLDKKSFGCLELPAWISEKTGGAVPSEIGLCGVCTDICVISNALILKAAYPETVVTVDGSCCAGVTPESHETALSAMRACQVLVK